jgi:hypothetical protein
MKDTPLLFFILEFVEIEGLIHLSMHSLKRVGVE